MKRKYGVLISCSNAGTMSVPALKRYIDLMKKMGYSLLEWGLDDCFEVDGEPFYGYLRGRYSKEELKEVVAYAAKKGIEVIPTIQTLAHLSNLQKIPAYADIFDTNGILLVDEPKTYTLIDHIFATLQQCFTSGVVHIGFDEARQIGLGRYLDLHGYQNAYEILLRHLEKVLKIAKKHGFKCQMWSDMFFRLANRGEYYVNQEIACSAIKRMVPSDITLIYWDYYSDSEERYQKMLSLHGQFPNELWFAGAAWTFEGFAPLNGYSLRNTIPAIKALKNSNVKNVFFCLWGDDGSECSCFAAIPALYASRKFLDGIFDMNQIKADFQKDMGYSFDDFMVLDLPNKNKLNPNLDHLDNSCKFLLYSDPFLGWKDYALPKAMPIPFDSYAKTLRDTGKRMGEYQGLFDNLANLCDVLNDKYALGILTRMAYQKGDKDTLKKLVLQYRKAAQEMDAFHDSFRAQWMHDNKPFGWEIHEIRLSGVKGRLLDCASRIEEYLAGKAASIPELELKLLDYAPFESMYNLYRGFVTPVDL